MNQNNYFELRSFFYIVRKKLGDGKRLQILPGLFGAVKEKKMAIGNKKQSKAAKITAVILCTMMTVNCGGAGSPGSEARVASQSHTDSYPKQSVKVVRPRPEAPPHIFTPSSHSPIYRRDVSPAPNLADLPALEMRFEKCFGRLEKQPIPIATSKPPKKYIPPKKKASSAKKPTQPHTPLSGAVPRSQVPTPMGAGGASSMGTGAGALESAPSFSTAPSSTSAGSVSESKQRSSKRDRSERSKRKEPSSNAESAMPAQAAMDMDYAAEAYEESNDDSRAFSTKKIATEPDYPQPEPEPEPDPDDVYADWGQAVYLSNDDTMSLSSAQRIIYAIDNFQPLPQEHIRPHELLNYFSFNTEGVRDGYDFSVKADLIPDQKEKGIYSLGLAVKGRPVDKISRRNAVITLVIDRSGSMHDEGRMDYLKRGLLRMVDELKTGDMVHVVLFDHEVCVPTENFVIGRDSRERLENVFYALSPRGATDLHSGLLKGYEIADKTYRNNFSNRVLLITDALTNTGITDESMISMISRYYDSRRIRLSGMGVGNEFNDSLLDKLTEKGKGAYVFLGSEAEVDAVFGNRFISLIETTAVDVRFRLHLPPSLRMNVFYGEESSTFREDVQQIHYFANTSQLFLSDLMSRNKQLRPQDDIMLSIEYRDPETENPLVEEYAFNLGNILNTGLNAKKGRLIMTWVDLLAAMAERPQQYYDYYAEGSWQDEEGWNRCENGKQMLNSMAADLSYDPEVTRVRQLFDKYCARFERPRHPNRRAVTPPDGSWPGATTN